MNKFIIRLPRWRQGQPNQPSENPRKLSARSLSLCSTEEARVKVPEALALRLQVLPLGLIETDGGKAISYAAQCASSYEVEKELRFATGYAVKLIPIDAEALAEAILLAYRGGEQNLAQAVGNLALAQTESEPTPRIIETPNSGPPQFLVKLIDYAFAKGASDIHLSPRPKGTVIKMRIQGQLFEHAAPLGSSISHSQLVNRLKVLAKLNLQEKNLPQDGSFEVPFGQKSFQVRLSLLPTIHGEQAVLRLATEEGSLELSDLGFRESLLEQIREVLQAARGAIVVAGPTGSGKTSTLYALAKILHGANLHVTTIEDPIERQIPGLTQVQVQEALGRDYQTCLKAMLRQDPNVILVGELRDPQSAQTAFQAAITGHLLLTTVHASTPREVLLRLRHLGIDSLSISQSLGLILCQQLIPTLCENCKVWDLAASRGRGFDVFKPVGCSHCDYAGFAGRALVTESIVMDAELRDLLLRKEGFLELERAIKSAPSYLDPESLLLELLRLGKISLAQFQ